MTVRKFMYDLRRSKRKLERLSLAIDGARARLYNTHKNLKDVDVQTSIDNTSDDAVIAVMEIEEDLNREVAQYLRDVRTFFRVINVVSDEVKKEALQMYIVGDIESNKLYSQEEVADMMGYSDRQIRFFITDSINEIERKIN